MSDNSFKIGDLVRFKKLPYQAVIAGFVATEKLTAQESEFVSVVVDLKNQVPVQLTVHQEILIRVEEVAPDVPRKPDYVAKRKTPGTKKSEFWQGIGKAPK